MKKTWQIWSLFFLCLVAVAAAMLWLSLKTVRLDAMRETDRAETELARREAELQQRISSSLYRMDLKMLPLVAQEASRPANFYRPFYEIASWANPSAQQAQNSGNFNNNLKLASPLLVQSSEWVLLHFEIAADSTLTSPQFPENEERKTAIAAYQVQEAALDTTLTKMDQARSLFNYSTLLQKTAQGSKAALDNPNANGNQAYYNYNSAAENIQAQIKKQGNNNDDDDYFGNVSKGTKGGNKAAMQRSRGAQRINEDFDNRLNSTQTFTDLNQSRNQYQQWEQVAAANNLANDVEPYLPSTDLAPHYPMQPIWFGENLIMARRVNQGKQDVVQCCWLDWEKIKTELQNDVAELLPNLQFEAVTKETQLKIGTALTTLPVQIIVDRPALLAMLAFDTHTSEINSALPISLFTAWGCLALAALASALLLRGVIGLSERRAAFVSAVTHELRTPLTTFRMYSEMLADGMVPPEKQQQYTSTLKVQADRLSHLVENVLQFAKLERGPAKITNEAITVAEVFDRCQTRMEERARDSQMQLIVDVEDSVADIVLTTQPSGIEQILFNLVDNACKYANAADDNRIVISVEKSTRHIRFGVRDFGPGITPADRKRIFRPFQQSASATANAISGVGLGLALCNRMATSLGGRLDENECEAGASFVLELPL